MNEEMTPQMRYYYRNKHKIYEQHKTHNGEYQKRYRLAHPGYYYEYHKQYRELNKEKMKGHRIKYLNKKNELKTLNQIIDVKLDLKSRNISCLLDIFEDEMLFN